MHAGRLIESTDTIVASSKKHNLHLTHDDKTRAKT
jgi:hypothetical protein